MMNRCQTFYAGILGLGISLSGIARADDETNKGDLPDIRIFEQLDKNQDGKLTADEIPEDKKRFLEQLIRESDKNEDGVLEKEEYLTPPEKKSGVDLAPEFRRPGGQEGKPRREPAEIFKRADKNGDDKLTLDELPERMAERLKPLMEKSGKTELSLEDFERMIARRGGSPKKTGGGKMDQGRPGPEQLFKAADKDGDGKVYLKDVTGQELTALEKLYEKIGKDSEDSITLDEILEAMPPRPQGRPRPPMMRPGEGEEGDGPPPRHPPHPPKFVMLLDKDEDGLISKEELDNLKNLFAELDEDEDGMLSHEELLGPPPEHPDGMLRRGQSPDDESMPRQRWKNRKNQKRPKPPGDEAGPPQ